jgi:hypothetical protein
MEPTPMESTTTDVNTTELLLDLLKRAAAAHGIHEKRTGSTRRRSGSRILTGHNGTPHT